MGYILDVLVGYEITPPLPAHAKVARGYFVTKYFGGLEKNDLPISVRAPDIQYLSNLGYSRFCIFAWKNENMEYSRFRILLSKNLNLEYSRYQKWSEHNHVTLPTIYPTQYNMTGTNITLHIFALILGHSGTGISFTLYQHCFSFIIMTNTK